MFERFSQDAREVVVQAQDQARRLHHPGVGTSHLLLAVLAGKSPVAQVLRSHGLATDVVEQAIAELLGPPRPSPPIDPPDATALAALGIDVERIRESVEAAFGPGALERAVSRADRPGTGRSIRSARSARSARSGWLGRRHPRRDRRTPVREVDLLRVDKVCQGHLPFGADAKKALELALREALRLRDGHIGTEHLVLGLLRGSDTVAIGVLDRLQVDPADLRRSIERTRRRSA